MLRVPPGPGIVVSTRQRRKPCILTHFIEYSKDCQLKAALVPPAAAKLLQSYLTLCDPIDGSPPGSPVPGILQARTLESVAISFSNV